MVTVMQMVMETGRVTMQRQTDGTICEMGCQLAAWHAVLGALTVHCVQVPSPLFPARASRGATRRALLVSLAVYYWAQQPARRQFVPRLVKQWPHGAIGRPERRSLPSAYSVRATLSSWCLN